MKTKKELLALAHTLPTSPGCYLMKNAKNEVIYVGKAKNLKNRVTSYFTEAQKNLKTEVLVSHIRNVEFLITESESSALVVENNLIKKHSPKYNIMLKDDKSYPYVVINHDEDFPRLEYQRRPERGGKKEIFGPFVWGSRLGETLKILTKTFALRDCSKRDFLSRKEPCLLYQMKQCSAPCVGYIPKQDYDEDMQLAMNFFKGKGKQSLKILNSRMMKAAEEEEFERAAVIRDSIEILENFVNFQQKLAENHKGKKNRDFFAFYIGEDEIDISIYMMRRGVILGHKNFHFPVNDMIDSEREEIIDYLMQYYLNTYEELPDELIGPFEKSEAELMQATFDEAFKDEAKSMKVKSARGQNKGFVDLTQEHAAESQRVRLAYHNSVFSGLNKLQEFLGMKERPVVLECYDVAIFQGKSPTASQIVFKDGKPDKKQYRYYHLEERPEGNNDFAMMKEVMRRRLDNGKLPDALVIDGGVGQVNMVIEILKEFDLEIPVCGIAKSKTLTNEKNFQKKEIEKSDERLIIPGRSNAVVLSKYPALFKILVQMRDEAHRFSRKLHHKTEKKRLIKSWLNDIPGIGEATRKEIMKNLIYTKSEIKEMNLDQIARSLGISAKLAKKIKENI